MSKPTTTVLVGAGYTTDVSSWVRLADGVSIQRGRADEFSEVQASTCSLTLDASTTTLPAAVVVGAPIRVQVTANGVTTNRFTGVVDALSTSWPGGSRFTTVLVSASDALASLARRSFRDLVSETTAAPIPSSYAYWPLNEDADSASAGDRSGNGWPPFVARSRGVDGGVEFGSGTASTTFGGSCVQVTQGTKPTDGGWLEAVSSKPFPLESVALGFTVAADAPAASFLFRAGSDMTGVQFRIASGQLLFERFYGSVGTTLVGPSVMDGRPHRALATRSYNAGTQTESWKLYVDGVLVDSNTVPVPTTMTWPTTAYLGGDNAPNRWLASASLWGLGMWGRELTSTEAAADGSAATTGYAGERSDQRIARYAAWAGVTSTALETGTVLVAHADTADQSPLSMMQLVAATERGLVFVNGSGQLTFHSRAHRYNPTWGALVDADALDDSATFTTDTQDLVNSASVTRPGGGGGSYADTASIAAFDEYPKDAELLYVTDDECYQAAASWVRTRGTPQPRISTVGIDLMTLDSTWTQQFQAIDLGSLIGVTGLPAQAPASGISLFVEGWTETIGASEWSMALNTSTAAYAEVWQLETPPHAQLDTWRLA